MPKGKSNKNEKDPLSKNEKKEVVKIAQKVVKGHLETKLIVNAVAGTVFAANVGQLLDQCTIAQGLTQNTRVGLTIHPTGFKARHTFSSPNNTMIRLIYFMWHADSAVSVPIATSILDIGAGGVNADCLSQHNWYNRSQYTILYDQTRVSNVQSTQEVLFFVNVKRKLKQIMYNTGAAITNGENHIYYLVISETGSTMSYVSEVRYTDA